MHLKVLIQDIDLRELLKNIKGMKTKTKNQKKQKYSCLLTFLKNHHKITKIKKLSKNKKKGGHRGINL